MKTVKITFKSNYSDEFPTTHEYQDVEKTYFENGFFVVRLNDITCNTLHYHNCDVIESVVEMVRANSRSVVDDGLSKI